MNNPSPLVPQGSLQPQPKKKITFPMAVFTIGLLHVLAIGVLLIQGCNKNNKKTDDASLDAATNSGLPPYNPPTNTYFAPAASNTLAPTNPVAPLSGLAAAPSNASPFTEAKPVDLAPPVSDEKEYVVVKGDMLSSIAKKHSVSLAALEKANPGVDAKKLKVGQKLKIPGGAAAPDSTGAAHAAGGESSGTGSYTVKAGDNLTRIAKSHGTTAPRLRALNSLSTDKLKVGQKLKLPAGGAEKTVAAKPADDAAAIPTVPAATSTNILR